MIDHICILLTYLLEVRLLLSGERAMLPKARFGALDMAQLPFPQFKTVHSHC